MQITVFTVRKLVDSVVVINTVSTKSSSSPLLFLKNRLSSAKFLMNTGASVSVFPDLPCSPSAPGSFIQVKVYQIFQGLPCCFVYVDDILMFSSDLGSHLEHELRVFDLL